MFASFDKRPESRLVTRGGRNAHQALLEFLGAGGNGETQIMERLGADPAKGFPVQRRHPVDKQEKHLQERRRTGLFTDIRRKAGESVHDAQRATDPFHIGEDIESRLRLQTADPRDGVEPGHNQVAAHLKRLHHAF